MTRHFPLIFVYIVILSMFLQSRQIHCLRRLMRRKLSSEDKGDSITSDDIRGLVSASLDSNDLRTMENNKRDTSRDQAEEAASIDTQAEDDVASESRDASFYEDEVDEDDGGQQVDDSEYKRSAGDASSSSRLSERSIDQSDLASYDDSDLTEVKDVTKREAKSEDDYEDDLDGGLNSPEASIPIDRKSARSALPASNEEPEKRDETPREVRAEAQSDLDYEEIENQIQQRIDSIKEDIKREVERKQRVREIEANNARFDELENNRDNGDLDNSEVVDEDSSKISSRDAIAAGRGESDRNVETDASAARKKRSDLSDHSEVVKVIDVKKTPLVVPVKRRSIERRVTFVKKRDSPNLTKRFGRSASILIPERGHAEVKDELPGDLRLDPNLRLARSSDETLSDDSRATRFRRDMSEDLENENEAINDEVNEPGNFLFAAREKPDCRTRRRRSRPRDRMRSIERRKARKHPRHSRRHRAIRASSANAEERGREERDKRDMSLLDDDAAQEYQESFGGFPSESGAAGRFKRIRRSAKVS